MVQIDELKQNNYTCLFRRFVQRRKHFPIPILVALFILQKNTTSHIVGLNSF